MELIDQMVIHPNFTGKGGKAETVEASKAGSCYDHEEFFKLTRHTAPKGMLVNGRMVAFDNGLVIRYLDKILVEDGGYRVLFKAGLEVEVKVKDRMNGCEVEMAI